VGFIETVLGISYNIGKKIMGGVAVW